MQIRYVGPYDECTITIADRDVDVRSGATVEVPAEVAGTPPTPERLAAEQALTAAEHAIPRMHDACAAARAALIDLADQIGSGLLAQPSNWQPFAAPKAPKATKDGE